MNKAKEEKKMGIRNSKIGGERTQLPKVRSWARWFHHQLTRVPFTPSCEFKSSANPPFSLN